MNFDHHLDHEANLRQTLLQASFADEVRVVLAFGARDQVLL
jgi:hypothetical protein